MQKPDDHTARPAVVTIAAAFAPFDSVARAAPRGDGIARLRGEEVIQPGEVPEAPVGAELVTFEDCNAQLHRVADDDIPVMLVALDRYADADADARDDLGDDAPSTDEAKKLARRVRAVVASERKLAAALASTRLQRQIVLSDAHAFLRDVSAQVLHRARRRPQLPRDFAAVLDYVARQSKAIREGLARRARQQKARSATETTADDGKA